MYMVFERGSEQFLNYQAFSEMKGVRHISVASLVGFNECAFS